MREDPTNARTKQRTNWKHSDPRPNCTMAKTMAQRIRSSLLMVPGHRGRKADDATTWDSSKNDLLDIVSLMETDGGHVEQSLIIPDAEHEDETTLDESLEVIFPHASTGNTSSGRDRPSLGRIVSAGSNMECDVDVAHADTMRFADGNDVKVPIDMDTDMILETSHEVERELVIDSPSKVGYEYVLTEIHPIAEIGVAPPMMTTTMAPSPCLAVSNEPEDLDSTQQSDSKYSKGTDLESYSNNMEHHLKEVTQRMFLEDLKRISAEHMTSTRSEGYSAAAILGEADAFTGSSETEEKERISRLAVLHGLIVNVLETTSNVITCGRSCQTTHDSDDDDGMAQAAAAKHEHAMSRILSELRRECADQSPTASHGDWHETQRIPDDDSTISTHMSMQLEMDYHY